jgi:type II secretory pathway pseudopilin PulG
MIRIPQHRHQQRKPSAGFTIIELLIATLVFAAVLVLISVGVLSFTRSYFRGVNQSATQNAARLIIENISQAIQFSGGDITSPIPRSTTPSAPTYSFDDPYSSGFCLGNQRYSYIAGWQLMDTGASAAQHQASHVLVQDSPGSCGGLPAQNVRANPNGTELLGPRMRLAKLKVDPTADPLVWRVTVRVVYGDNDLLCSPSVSGDCDSIATTTSLNKDDLTCKTAIKGSQYCAASELSTVVQKRIASSP